MGLSIATSARQDGDDSDENIKKMKPSQTKTRKVHVRSCLRLKVSYVSRKEVTRPKKERHLTALSPNSLRLKG